LLELIELIVNLRKSLGHNDTKELKELKSY